ALSRNCASRDRSDRFGAARDRRRTALSLQRFSASRMNEAPIVGSKTAQSVCAQCGSSLSSSEDAEELCLTCLLNTALGRADVDQAGRPQRFDQYELVNGTDGEPVELGRGAMG